MYMSRQHLGDFIPNYDQGMSLRNSRKPHNSNACDIVCFCHLAKTCNKGDGPRAVLHFTFSGTFQQLADHDCSDVPHERLEAAEHLYVAQEDLWITSATQHTLWIHSKPANMAVFFHLSTVGRFWFCSG